MKILKTAALALALVAPGMAMAADGPLGPTSSAQMNVSLTVAPNTDDYVQIVGLEDVVFTGFTFGASNSQQADQFFCLNKNTPGTVSLNITSASPGNAIGGNLYINSLVNGSHTADLFVALATPAGQNTPANSAGFSNIVANDPNTCTATSGLGVAHKLSMQVEALTFAAGTYSNTFTLTLSPN